MDYKHNVILVIDDNINNIKVVVDSLTSHRFEIAIAKNGTIGIS